jgi:hypothetical protein
MKEYETRLIMLYSKICNVVNREIPCKNTYKQLGGVGRYLNNI